MSDLPFLCRKCGERLSAPRGTEGRKATCHVCGEEMLVPHAGMVGGPVPRGDAITAAPAPPPAPAPPSLPTTIQASLLPPPLPAPPMAGYGHAKAAPPHTATRNDPGHVSRRLIAVGAALFVLVGFCVLSGAGLVAIYLLNRGAPADAHAKGAPAPQDKAPAKDKDSAPTTSKPTVAKGKQDTGDKPPDAESPPPKKDGPLSLDAHGPLVKRNEGDAAVIDWLMKNAPQGSILLEASGDPYSEFARISSHTGIPTVLGWANHEGLWRASAKAEDPEVMERLGQIKLFYTTPNPTVAYQILQRYHVTHVILGDMERRTYGSNPALEGFSFLFPVFQKGGTTVYAVAMPR